MGLPTAGVNKMFLNHYTEINKTDYYPSLERAMIRKKTIQRFPNNKEIEIALAEKDVYNIQSKNIIYFLELLENYNNKEYVSVDNPNITIEHIFPQNPDAKWYDVLDQTSIKEIQEKYLNTISNLTLSGNNGSLGNKLFMEKKVLNKDGKEQGYIYSRLWLNQFLKEIDECIVSANYERAVTLSYTCLEGFYKSFAKAKIPVVINDKAIFFILFPFLFIEKVYQLFFYLVCL